MTAAGFTLAGADHAIIPVMLGEATVAQQFARELQKKVFTSPDSSTRWYQKARRVSVPRCLRRIPLNKLNVRWKPLPASVNNWASLPEGVR